ncbi:hypothetical protein [Oceaniradius stylonematis]|uniref:hypothetical protein n=1 Tax=Oceaniradius stylonematis TaxID=2184161 RepID=UPI003B5CC0CE
MTATALTAEQVWLGKPVVNGHQPSPVEIVRILNIVQLGIAASQGGLIVRDTKATLDADLAHDEGTLAFVYNDATISNRTLYRKVGASASGSWTSIPELAQKYIPLTNAGAGTGNAIELTSEVALPSTAYGGKFLAEITDANGAGGVTIEINGATAKTLVTNTGSPIEDGYLTDGMVIEFVDDGTNYRLTSDVASAAIQAAAEAALAEFLEQYLRAHANDNAATTAAGGAPITGALYWNTTDNVLKVYDGANWSLTTANVADGAVTEVKLAASLTAQITTMTASLTTLRSVDVARYQTAYVRDRAQGGSFDWRAGDQTALGVVKSVTTTTVNDGTDTFTATAHGLETTDAVVQTTTANGVTLQTLKRVIKVDADNFRLADSFADALAGTPTNITGTTNVTFRHLRDPSQAIYVIRTGDPLDGSGGLWERRKGSQDERSWWPLTNEGLQDATDFANVLLFATGSESATRISIKKDSVTWRGEGMFASVVNFTHSSGNGIVNTLATATTLRNGLIVEDMQITAAALTGSGAAVQLKNFAYSHFERVYFFGVQVNQTWALDIRGTWPYGTYYSSVQHCLFGLFNFGVYLGDGGNNNYIAHNRFQQACPAGGQCITIDGSQAGYVSSTLLLANITELPGQTTTGIYIGAAADGVTIINHRYESMATGLIVALGAKHVENINPYYEGNTTNVNNASRGLARREIAAGWFYGITGIIENELPNNATVVRAQAGLYRITFQTAPPSANYAALLSAKDRRVNLVAKTSTYLDVETIDRGTGNRADSDDISYQVLMAA